MCHSSTMEQEEDPFPGHKLCGYLCAVLSAPSPEDFLASSSLPFLSPCRAFSDGARVGFVTGQDNVFLSTVARLVPQETVAVVAENTEISYENRSGSSGRRKSRGKIGGCMSRNESRTKRKIVRGIGMVNGSLSVVHQIHSLVTHKCVQADARVLQVEVRESDCDVRVVVLVDVYLPIALWSGWQFPRSGPVAGPLFRHFRSHFRGVCLGEILPSVWWPLSQMQRVVSPTCHHTCKHLLCIDCVALDSERCTSLGCTHLYEMQTPLTRPENPNPKWPVPKDLIELQPSYKQDDWHPDWQSTSSSKVAYLVARLKALQEDNKASWHRIYKKYDSLNVEGQQGDPQLVSGSTGEEDCNSTACRLVQDKVIIFSQFLEHIHVIEQQLTLAGIKFAGLYSPMHSHNKVKSLATLRNDMECVALLMDGSAALGLDLSFVSHVFLMEPIWDRSMEEQVVSRAHRMGSTRPIYVETLAMRSTIEEQMVDFLQGANNSDEGTKHLKQEYEERPAQEGTPRTLHDFAECNYLAKT